MVIKTVELETVCGITSKLPENEKPEVAFAGKSNVGKSSLINGLMNRKSLARTSAQPGKTQTINYYNINQQMYFVDLPGYGYAKVPTREKEKWGRMIEDYLHTSHQLKAVFLLIDIRHEPSGNDRQMYEWIVYHGFDPIIIATKQDKLNRSQIPKHIKMIRDGLHVKPGTYVFPYSALTKQGRDEIWAFIDGMLGFAEEVPEDGNSFLQGREGDGSPTAGDAMQEGEGASFQTAGNPMQEGQEEASGQENEENAGTQEPSPEQEGGQAKTRTRKPRRKAGDLPKKLRKKKEAKQLGPAGTKKKNSPAKTGGKRGKK